jgi:hypothetical protein
VTPAASTEPGWNTLVPGSDFAYYNLDRNAVSGFSEASITRGVCDFSLVAAADHKTEGTESFRIVAVYKPDYTEALSGLRPSIPFSYSDTYYVNDTSQDISYAIEADRLTVNEGSKVTWRVTSTNIANGTVYYWKNFGTTVAADFVENVNSGTVTVVNNSATIVLTLLADSLTEGDQTVIIGIGPSILDYPVRASAVTVKDTSIGAGPPPTLPPPTLPPTLPTLLCSPRNLKYRKAAQPSGP